ncbi:MAG: hypothetical protein ACRDWY_02805 [Actinomycetes bacterium]
MSRTGRRRGPAIGGVCVVIVTAALLSGCKEAEVTNSYSSGYEPSHVEEVADSEVKEVSFTEIGADRVGLETATVREAGGQFAVPYASLIYDGQGIPWVFTVHDDLTFLRAPVVIDRIEGDTVLISEGPPVGTEVVTVGAAEVWGAELEIAGGH